MLIVPITSEAVDGWFKAAVASWETSLRAGRKSPATLKVYLGTCRLFADFLVERGYPTRPDAIRPEHVREYLITITTPTTARLRYQTLVTFFKYLVREGELEASPLDKVDSPAQPDQEAERTFITDAEFERMVATCRRGRRSTFFDRRDLAILLLMRRSGLRRSEVGALAVDDVNVRDRYVVVRLGKGAKSRIAAFDHSAAGPLAAYAAARVEYLRERDMPADFGAYFVDNRKHGMNSESIGAVVQRRATLAGLGVVGAHQLRHAWAHEMKSRGMSDESLMKLAGWSDIQIAQRYGRALSRQRAIDEYHRLVEG